MEKQKDVILILDTTSEELFLSLIVGEEEKRCYLKDCKSTHSVLLLKKIDELLTENGLQIKDVNCVALSVGPGSFTGIRIGVSTAKAFQYALGLKIIAVNSLEACAYNYKGQNTCVIIDAKHDNAYTGIFDGESNKLGFFNRKTIDNLKENKLFISPYANSFGAEVVENYYDGFVALVKERAKMGLYDEDFAPLYLKLSQAEEEENAL
ncbi:MAG: tRNA (adenosine(37)-N6)-threonylcarbamoyltransferase complex dimerization subunit type 1 TsaB [Clostridia bacterium]|nr:tRNA (adenosine(37)-N6)-threonylcarbamoyltransferase complex dimerization subunit type 1 TsaB [Clostridia bacterium]